MLERKTKKLSSKKNRVGKCGRGNREEIYLQGKNQGK